MSDKYFDIDGNETTLFRLVRTEPEWAENIIRKLKHDMADAVRECGLIALNYKAAGCGHQHVCGEYLAATRIDCAIRNRFPEYFKDDK